MNIGMTILLLTYTAVVVWVTRRAGEALVQRDLDEVDAIRKRHEELLRIEKELAEEKKGLEGGVTRIFTLYDLTRAMTKTFSEEQALGTFRSKLAENLFFRDCVLLGPFAEEEVKEKAEEGYSLLPLTGQRRKLGTLALSGVPDEDKEKLNILANQFALSLRRVRLYQDIERLAITDSLTEVHTRRYVMERFEEELLRAQARKSHMAFLMVDIDFFKTYNDKYGHLTGDQLLRQIAALIKANIREIDIIGRYGGEEFCVVLPDTDHGGAGYVAERVRSAVEKATIRAYDTKATATVSIGISVYPQDGKKMRELTDKADGALYRAKKQGRNQVCAFGVYEREDNS